MDDDEDFRSSLATFLEAEGASVRTADSVSRAREACVSEAFDALLVDLHLPDGEGSELLDGREDFVGSPELIFVTGKGSVEAAVDALKRGALDFLEKPFDPAVLRGLFAKLRRARTYKREITDLRMRLRRHGRFGAVVGRSRAMQPVFDLIQRVAPTQASVLIQGDSGTGKEVVAETIHMMSGRAGGPWVPVNCGAIPESLIESELFGHERGSFTGAEKMRQGVFERADEGTLFLDEITEMPSQLQVKLLRVLESREVQRVGGSKPFGVDVRVLAATNRNPREAVRLGKLREDLFFRLAVFPVELPPLRERTGDVALLAQHFLDVLNERDGTAKRWDPAALEHLATLEWPGNVRELKNVVERSFILAEDVLTVEGAGTTPAGAAAGEGGEGAPGTVVVKVGASIADAERDLILATLEHTKGDKPAASKILGISLKTLYNRLNVYEAAQQGG